MAHSSNTTTASGGTVNSSTKITSKSVFCMIMPTQHKQESDTTSDKFTLALLLIDLGFALRTEIIQSKIQTFFGKIYFIWNDSLASRKKEQSFTG